MTKPAVDIKTWRERLEAAGFRVLDADRRASPFPPGHVRHLVPDAACYSSATCR